MVLTNYLELLTILLLTYGRLYMDEFILSVITKNVLNNVNEFIDFFLLANSH